MIALRAMPRSAVPSAPAVPGPTTAQVVTAFAAVYIVWGSTYLGIRFAIETLPPLLMASVRFLFAGSLLYGWAIARGASHPTARQWRAAAIVGVLLFVGGNGAVVLAEQWVPSGLVALLVAAVPLWLVLLDWLWGSRTSPGPRALVGLAAGFLGVALLVGSPDVGARGGRGLLGAGLVVAGSLAWAAGSIYSRHAPRPERPRMWVAMQMLLGGAFLLPVAAMTGELSRFDPAAVSTRSVVALLYLVFIGALVGFTAYIWLLTVSTPARVGTYAYVNPVVALFLGWALADEHVAPGALVAAAVIVGSVVLITTGGRSAAPATPRAPRPR